MHTTLETATRAVARVVCVVALAVLLQPALLLLPGGATAAADVTVAASRAEPGARDVTITFRVTNPAPGVPTTRLEVFLPTVRPLLGVRPTAPGGWTARVTTASPAAPLTADGAPVGTITTAVAWEGGVLADGRYAVFPLDVDRLPDGPGPLRFRVVQTAANGATEEWSDLVPYGAPAPAHPALVVPYRVAPEARGDAVPPAPADAALAEAHQHGGGTASIPVGGGGAVATAWFVVVAGLVAWAVAAGAAALGRRQRRSLAERGALSRRDRRP